MPIPASSFIEALPLTGPSRTFVFDRKLSYPVDAFTTNSRWLLYENGAFEAQYGGARPLRGVYRIENGVFSCVFVSTESGPVIARFSPLGTLAGDVLTIDWDEIAEESGWQDAVYVLVP